MPTFQHLRELAITNSEAVFAMLRVFWPLWSGLSVLWFFCPGYLTSIRLAWVTSFVFCFSCTSWLVHPAGRGAFAYQCALLAVLCPDLVASPALRGVFWLMTLAHSSIPARSGSPSPQGLVHSLVSKLFQIATMALLANTVYISLAVHMEERIAVSWTAPYRGLVTEVCPEKVLQSGHHRFNIAASDEYSIRHDDSALATSWLLHRILDSALSADLEPTFCDIDLMLHVLCPSGDLPPPAQALLQTSDKSEKLARRLRCANESMDTVQPPALQAIDMTISSNLVALVQLREYFADAIMTYTKELVPFFDSLHSYADWHFDAHHRLVPTETSMFDNAFAMVCDALPAGDWSVVALWLWLRCKAFPSDDISTTSRYSLLKWIRWMLSNPSSRQLRDHLLPNMHTMLEQQLSLLPNLTRSSLIPSWSDRHLTASGLGQKHRLPFEYLAMYEIKTLPSLPFATDGQPDKATFNAISAHQALMGITDDQATRFNALLDALRDKGHEQYGFGTGRSVSFDGQPNLIDRIDVFLDWMLGNRTSSSSSSSSPASRWNSQSGKAEPSITSPGALPCVLALIRDNVLGFRVTGRWTTTRGSSEKDRMERLGKLEQVADMKHRANGKRLLRGSFVWLMEEGQKEMKKEWWQL